MSGGWWLVDGGRKGGRKERVTLGEIRPSETSDSRCSFQKVHKKYLLQEFLFMKKF